MVCIAIFKAENGEFMAILLVRVKLLPALFVGFVLDWAEFHNKFALHKIQTTKQELFVPNYIFL